MVDDRQQRLFPSREMPRHPRRVMMHVVDAGPGDWGDIVRLECRKCGHGTGWSEELPGDKRGRPCPICNARLLDGRTWDGRPG